MKKYILLFAILMLPQLVQGQRGGWNYFFTKGGNRINQANTLDTLVLNNLKMSGTFTAGSALTVNSVGNVSVGGTGTTTFGGFLSKPEFLEYLGASLEATPTTGAGDSTAFYIPMKMFSTSDSATIDFAVDKRFTSLDSIVLLGGTISTLGDSAAFSIRIKQTVFSGAYAGAFNAAVIDSSDLGTANTQKRWKFSSFGSLTASSRSTIRAKIWRSACTNNTGSDVYIERVLIYGVGLR